MHVVARLICHFVLLVDFALCSATAFCRLPFCAVQSTFDLCHILVMVVETLACYMVLGGEVAEICTPGEHCRLTVVAGHLAIATLVTWKLGFALGQSSFDLNER